MAAAFAPAAAGQDKQLLVFSKTAGFRHNSIPAGIEALKKMGREQGFSITATEDAAFFTDEKLAAYHAVIFLNTTGDILDEEQQAAFERYIQAGHGFVGIHSATDTEYEWPWYGKLVGAYFKSHPPTAKGKLKVVDHSHPSTKGLPREFMHKDEWYDFRKNPSSSEVTVLVTIDETSYDHGENKAHPVSWYHEFDGGRAFYTLMGHMPESFSNPLVLKHLSGGIRYVLEGS
ncbi:ThuA domain-containing protein [Anseongella ginsenosidimutans]|nr:ThuA domain-containing protein [Anseongella ginsenosidimutans]